MTTITTPFHAWHFVGKTLRDGNPVPANGVPLIHPGPVVLCESGLHYSRHPYDALRYAPGDTLCLVECSGEVVECSGEVVEGDDKGACSVRTIIARVDAAPMLRYFARMQALSVVHLWDAPDIVLDYLMTGDEALRDAARAAARAAAWAAARAAARDAARAAARAAARDAAWAAARAAARDAARDAAWAAARAAAWDATWDAVWDAVWDAANAAARAEFEALAHETFSDYL